VKPLTNPERQLALAAARCIATAEEIGLPDRPEKIVTSPAAIRVLARGYLELREQLSALHDLVDRGDPGDPIGIAIAKAGLPRPQPADDLHQPVGAELHARLWQPLARLGLNGWGRNALASAGICYVGELVQVDRRTLLRLKNFGKTSLHEIEEKLAQQGLCFGVALEGWPGPRWECRGTYPFLAKIGPQIASGEAGAAPEPLLALYCRVMGDVEAALTAHDRFVVRHWDGMDGCWTNCTGEVGRDEALRVWAERTSGGTRQVSYAEIDYYRIFPGGTRMHWDGSEGREMHR
jgi:hypothetical protein